jgi:hypothetical protein
VTENVADECFEVAVWTGHMTMALLDLVDACRGQHPASMIGPNLLIDWENADGFARAAVLLHLAWVSRESPLGLDPGAAERHAEALQDWAIDFTGDQEAFLGPSFPAPPLPGPAGNYATDCAFDVTELDASLTTALFLAAAARGQ